MARDRIEQAWPPRGLRIAEAARYLGVGQTKFGVLVKDGRLPAPKRIDGCVVWDRLALDDAFEAIPVDEAEKPNPWDHVA